MSPPLPGSAVGQVFLPSEIITGIISFLKTDGASLAACMQVNSQWAKFAGEFLWVRCGYGPGLCEETGLRSPPEIGRLANLCYESGRRQYYANFIRFLSFGVDNDRSLGFDIGDNDKTQNHGKHHAAFLEITFPRLDSVSFGCGATGFILNNTRFLKQYLSPNLRKFSGFGPGGVGNLSDEFFIAMKV